MSKKIIGVTVGTPISPAKMKKELRPVQTVNSVAPDENGNVDVAGGSGGGTGDSGATFTPAVDENGNLSWTNDKGLPNPAPVNIKGDPGEKGEPGDPYTLTEADMDDIVSRVLAEIPETPTYTGEVEVE